MMLEDKYILLAHKSFSGQLSAEEQCELDDWIRLDPANQILIEQLNSVWKQSADFQPVTNPDLNKAKANFFSLIAAEEKSPVLPSKQFAQFSIRRLYQWTAVAAGIILIIGAFFYFNHGRSDLPSFMEGRELTAEFKETRQVEQLNLPDGTQIWFKPGTRISMDERFNKDDRKIFLSGDIFTKVAPDKAKPFRIILEHGQVEVLGTQFYLSSGANGKGHLKLLEGKVKVSGKSTEFTLQDQAAIILDLAQDSIIIPDSLNQISSDWVNEYLVFENASLQQVFDKLARFYNVNFEIDCPEISKMKGFTSFIHQQDNPRLSAYIEAVKKVYNLDIDKIAETRYRVSGEPCF